MSPIYYSFYKSKLGDLKIASVDDQLCMLDWTYRKMRKSIDQRIQSYINGSWIEETTDFHKEVIQQIEAYEQGNLQNFDLPLMMCGTSFQKEVWSNLMAIPYGETLSYLELSKKMNNTKAIRAVASANGANAISIIVPCHRIIGSNGEMVGYAGGIPTKKKLLRLEGAIQEDLQFKLF